MRRILTAIATGSLACALSVPALASPRTVEHVLTAAPIGTEVTISTSGDILSHKPVFNAAKIKGGYDFAPLLAGIKPLLTADVNFCHLETPLSKKTPTGFPLFHTPVQLATAIKKAGFQGCSVSSNHSLDAGIESVFLTKRTMQAAGLTTAGSRMSATDSAVGWYTTSKGVRVAQLAYTFGFNGIPRPKSKAWALDLIDAKAIIAAAKAARQAGAQLVVVNLHWGVEYVASATSAQKSLAKTLTASPYIDAIVGQHAHVVQDAAMVNGKPVIYGTGNLLSNQGPWAGMKDGQHGVIVTLKFRVESKSSKFVSGSYVPTFTPRYTYKVSAAKSQLRSNNGTEACRSVKDSAKHLSKLLSGPTTC